ncbi:MAG: GNAT family N-acetyltransferase [Defluviitaleaceae bacterium]|nr:GNAT family N-acetyltransferase [Defluviitaleaceae bacterium]
MEIRKLRPEENVHRKLMSAICFSRYMPAEDRYAWLEKPEDHTENYEKAWGAFDDDGKLVSAMIVDPAEIMINGKKAKAGLIAAVTTLPEARNNGSIRKLFEAAIPHMKEEGMVFSVLYPFSHEYYRKFGYEHNCVRSRVDFPISALDQYPYPGGMKAYDKVIPWEDFAKVYDVFSKDKNMAVTRGKKEWEAILKGDPHKDKAFAYVHYNNDEPDGYILYKAETRDNSGLINIRELAWSNIAGFKSILGFIYGMRSEYSQVSWSQPSGPDILGVVSDPFDVKWSWDSIIMTLVLDVQAALNLSVAPYGKGKLVIGVTDKFMNANNGAYMMSWADGRLKVETTNHPTDMDLDIETLAQLTTGFLTPAQALYRPGVVIRSKMEELTTLFPKKEQYMMEQF